MSGIARLRGVSLNVGWPQYAGTKKKVAEGKLQPWSSRKSTLATKIKAQKPDFVCLQEVGQTEAAELFAKLDGWRYARFGPLNVVGWREAVLTYVATQEVELADYGQWPGRGAVVVTLKDRAGNRFRTGSTHLTVKTAHDTAAQQAQIQTFVSAVNGETNDAPLVVGIDTNNRQNSLTGGMWRVLKKYGYRWRRKGIDAVLFNFGAEPVGDVETFDTGSASDHDGLVFVVRTTKR